MSICEDWKARQLADPEFVQEYIKILEASNTRLIRAAIALIQYCERIGSKILQVEKLDDYIRGLKDALDFEDGAHTSNTNESEASMSTTKRHPVRTADFGEWTEDTNETATSISQEQLDDIVQLLNQEIQWCHQNPTGYAITEEFHKGFIKGIEQAKYLIIHMNTQIVYASE